MRIHVICVVKNEADILPETLIQAAKWCDFIYVLDNGSDDGSWEITQTLAKDHPQIVPYKQDHRVFNDKMRRDAYLEYLPQARAGDWWGRLDADEIYYDNPREVLAAIEPKYDFIWSSVFNFFFSDAEAAAYEADPEKFCAMPVQLRCRHYLNNWSEPRFFRHGAGQFWPPEIDWPRFMNSDPVNRVRLKHYQYRSPEQIMQRIEVRRKTARDGGFAFFHENSEDFRKVVTDTNSSVEEHHRQTKDAGYKLTPRELDKLPAIDWRDRIVPSADLVLHEENAPLQDRVDLLPPIPDSPLPKRALRRVFRTGLGPFSNYF